MNESVHLPATLCSLVRQTHPPAKVYVCVNQPDAWHRGTEDQKAVCRDNRETLGWLREFKDLDLEILDRSSPGCGWREKQGGAGWARKVLLDAIDHAAEDRDIMVSMDADTFYEPRYLHAVHRAFSFHPRAVALAAPFYHRLGSSDAENRALLRYELYMRHYFLSLARIQSPYAFIALGSAVALPVRAYRRIRGITPFRAGEDFYFLQKLRKTGKVLNECDAVVYPSSRRSDRAGFGTGPAIAKGVRGDWRSYPFFPQASFDKIRETYRLFPDLYIRDRETPMDEFLVGRWGAASVWKPLRDNFNTVGHFVRACHERIDGLRLLQYLKFCRQSASDNPVDETVLADFIRHNLPERLLASLPLDLEGISFARSPVEDLDALRNAVFSYELDVRKGLS